MVVRPATEMGFKGPPSPLRRLRIISVAAEKGWETKDDGPLGVWAEEKPFEALVLLGPSLGLEAAIVNAPRVGRLGGCLFFAPRAVEVGNGAQCALSVWVLEDFRTLCDRRQVRFVLVKYIRLELELWSQFEVVQGGFSMDIGRYASTIDSYQRLQQYDNGLATSMKTISMLHLFDWYV